MAVEQNEIKKVITVDLGNTTTSLKEYKNHIDALRGSLLQLDETSEEYAAIAKEIKAEQDKLNEVMQVGKRATDAAEGSYNQLSQTMSELKKQWKATADEAERAELGQQILNINNQLKELDASTGNFQRNVGDYTNAFEKAFSKCLDGVTKIDGPIGELGGTVKQMIPIIKQINATALTGLSGIKKAIASTGIGLLVVAVGELVAHWEDLKNAVQKMIGVQDNYTQAVEASKRAMENLKKETEESNNQIDFQTKLLAAQGKTRLEQLNNQKQLQEEYKKQLKEKYNKEKDFYDLYKDAGAKSQRQEAQLAKERADAIFEQINAQNQLIEKTKESIKLEEAAQETAAKKRIQTIEEGLLTETEKLKKQYDEDIELANKYGLDTVAITEKYNKDLQALNDKAAKEKQNAQKTEAEIKAEQQKKEAEQIIKRVEKATTDELVLLEKTYNEEKKLLETLGIDTEKLTEEYEKNRLDIIAKNEEKIHTEKEKQLKKDFENLDTAAEQRKFDAEIEITDAQYLAEAKYQIEQDLIQRKIELQQEFLNNFVGTKEEQEAAEAELDALRQQYANNKKKYDKESADNAIKEADEEKKAKIAALNASLNMAGTVFGAMADLAEEGSEEQKNLQIAETTINTLAGAIGAFMQGMSSYPQPYGAIIGAAGAAAATAAGIAQIAKIKAVKPDSGSATVAAPNVQAPSMTSVSPLLDETNDLNRLETSGLQGDSQNQTQNMRVYVVEQDIREANHRAQVVEDNATF